VKEQSKTEIWLEMKPLGGQARLIESIFCTTFMSRISAVKYKLPPLTEK